MVKIYIRKSVTQNKKTKKEYVTHKLVESYRDIDGKVRQRVIMSLGKIDLPKIRWKELAALLEARISGQISFLENDNKLSILADDIMSHNNFVRTKDDENIKRNEDKKIEEIDLDTISTSYSRSLGPELVACHFWDILKFEKILGELNFTRKQIEISKAVILGRLIRPGSELSTWKWFKTRSTLLEMANEDLSEIGKDIFYEIGDLLYEHKNIIEAALVKVENSFFEDKNRVFLYDLTNTYLEGSGKNNNKAKRGRSKQKRSDCPLVTLALLVDNNGFPIFSQIYEGNQSEPKTLTDVIENLEKNLEIHTLEDKPVLIMDRGIATKANIDIIKSKQYKYTVINRAKDEVNYEDEFIEIKRYIKGFGSLIPEGWEKIENSDDIYVKKIVEESITKILTISVNKSYKENSIDTLNENRFLEAIKKLDNSILKGNILAPLKIAEKIGRIKAKYPSCVRYYNVEIKLSDLDEKKAVGLEYSRRDDKPNKTILNGCYVIETNQTEQKAEDIWNQYMELNHVENSFSDLKSSLGMRPIYHYKENRTDAHLFISVLAYHLLNTIEYNLKLNGDTRTWKTIREIMSTHQRSTIYLKNNCNEFYDIRISGLPEACHNKIYRMLNIKSNLKTFINKGIQKL